MPLLPPKRVGSHSPAAGCSGAMTKHNQSPVAGFIRTMALELRTLALKARLKSLAYLLEMVALEADSATKPPRRRRRRT